MILVLGIVYYLRPVWWESYRFENDQVRVRTSGTHDSYPVGTLVIRLTGTGMASCGWGYTAGKNPAGFASGSLLTIDSVSTQFTDDAGYADVSPDAGIARGERNLMGACQYHRGFLLLISRPAFVTQAETPRFDKVNQSYHVIHPPPVRRENMPMIEYARNRIDSELRLLYPTRIFASATRPQEVKERQALVSTVGYWRHKLPGGQTMRSYAIEHLLRVNEILDCPQLQAEVRRIFSDPVALPETEAAVLAEHTALWLSMSSKDRIESCEPGAGQVFNYPLQHEPFVK